MSQLVKTATLVPSCCRTSAVKSMSKIYASGRLDEQKYLSMKLHIVKSYTSVVVTMSHIRNH